MPYAVPRAPTSALPATVTNGTSVAYWLFSHTNSTGNFQMLAMFNASWKAPLLLAPSPKKATLTRSDFARRNAYADARRHQQARSDDAAGAEHANFGRKDVHAAATSVRAAARAAEQLGDQFARRNAFGQRVTVAAMGAEHRVVGAQVGAHADGNRFLADVGVAGAVDQPLRVRARQLLLGAANDQHLAIQGELVGRMRVRLRLARRCRSSEQPAGGLFDQAFDATAGSARRARRRRGGDRRSG